MPLSAQQSLPLPTSDRAARPPATDEAPTRKPRHGCRTRPADAARLRAAPRCGARTRRGGACRSPAVRGRARCRMHGGAAGSGAQPGNRNALRHGFYTAQARAARRATVAFIRDMESAVAALEAGDEAAFLSGAWARLTDAGFAAGAGDGTGFVSGAWARLAETGFAAGAQDAGDRTPRGPVSGA